MDSDRERLKEVHATDLTESRINEDFVDFLKKWGPTILLAILLGITAYLAMVRWRMHNQQSQAEAWTALRDAALPDSKLDVANAHQDLIGVRLLALNGAGTQLLFQVQLGRPLNQAAAIDPAEGATPPPVMDLTEEERTAYLDRAESAFGQVVQFDDGSLGLTLHITRALEGLAAIAEARGDAAKAAENHRRAAERAEPFYPALAAQAQRRAESAERAAGEVSFITQMQAQQPRPVDMPVSPAMVDPALRDLLTPPPPPDDENATR